jgi:Ca-activated chloride channel family protein
MAEALGWPDAPVGWQTLIDLANSPDGWAAYGHPEWGRLKLGHTHPQYSSAGLLFLASVIYAMADKVEGITPADVFSDQVETALRTLAQNTSKYGMVTTDLLNGMAERGPDFLHIASAFEEGTVRMNLEKADKLRWPLVFLFPKEGTFWSDHPYCVMDGLPGADPEAAEAARMFRDHLLSAPVQKTAGDNLVRPLDPSVPLGPNLSRQTGTDPEANPGNVPPFALPSPELSKAIIDQFLNTKRKATVVLALDTSGSMSGARITSATKASAEFIRRLNRDDRLGVLVFSGSVKPLGPVASVAEVGEERAAQVAGLYSGGGTAMNDAICRASQILDDERQKDAEAGEHRLYGIVLLSDGADSSSVTSTQKMMATCLKTDGAAAELGEGPRIFVIAYGEDVDNDVLQDLARRTGGSVLSADPQSLQSTYLKLSAEQ